MTSSTNTYYDTNEADANITKGVFRAAKDGDKESIIHGFNILPTLSKDCKDERGWTPLMYAARNGHVEVIKELLVQGADRNVVNSNGQNALALATFFKQTAAVQVLTDFLKPSGSQHSEFVNYFGTCLVDRQGYKRTNEHHMQKVMRSEKARFIVFAKLKLLVATFDSGLTSQLLYLTWRHLERVLQSSRPLECDVVFLGVGDVSKGAFARESIVTGEDTYAYFAVNFKKTPTEEELPIRSKKGAFTGQNPRDLTSLRHSESGLLAQARALLEWHDRYSFCPTCGYKTNLAESGYKRICTNDECVSLAGAHNTAFPRTDPVVIVLVSSVDNTKCLLGRQKRFPPGIYSCIAGFVEPGETIEAAARREVHEEAGVQVGNLRYHSSQPWPFPSSLMIGLIGEAVSDNIKVDHVELEDAKWFSRSDAAHAVAEGYRTEGLKVPPPTAIAHQLIKAWVKASASPSL